MSIDDQSGYRRIPADYDAMRWRHALFVEVRKSPRYRESVKHVREVWETEGKPGVSQENVSYWGGGSIDNNGKWSTFDPVDPTSKYALAVEEALKGVGLVENSEPVWWAIEFLHRDVAHVFSEHCVETVAVPSHHRSIEVTISPAYGGEIATYSDRGKIEAWQRLSTSQEMMLGDGDWRSFEESAVAAAKAAVRNLRNEVEADTTRGPMKRRALAREQQRAIQIERLALVLTGRTGTRNHSKTQNRLCDELGIDRPATTRTEP